MVISRIVVKIGVLWNVNVITELTNSQTLVALTPLAIWARMGNVYKFRGFSGIRER